MGTGAKAFGRAQRKEPSATGHHPVEYLGYHIICEQQPDGSWVANFLRIGNSSTCAGRSGPYPAKHLAFADSKRRIDATWAGPVQNRRHERVLAALDGVIFAKSGSQECQVLDLSQGGCRLHFHTPTTTHGRARLRPRKPIVHSGPIDEPFNRGDELILYIKGFGRFRVQIAQVRKGGIGVRFLSGNVAIIGLLKGLTNYVKGLDIVATRERNEVRVPTSITAVCRLADGAAIPCEIIDASTRSMSLRMSERPRIGSLVMLGGAKVRVARHHHTGIAVQCLTPPNSKAPRFNFAAG